MSDDERPSKRLKARAAAAPADSDDDDDDSDEGEEIIGKDGKKTKSKGGSSCHQCKSRRNFGALTYCTSNLDKKNKRCRKKFCGHCLKKFYRENVAHIVDLNTWKCPSCRKICCCAACRRRKNKEGAKEEAAMGDSPAQYKSKKSSSHKQRHRDEDYVGSGGQRGGGGAGQQRYTDDPYSGVQTNDEGYPIQSSHRRDRDRGSLLHGSSHSPRLHGHSLRGGDSPMRGALPHPYDLDGAEGSHNTRRRASKQQHSDHTDSDSHAYSDSDDTGGDGTDDDGGHHAPRHSGGGHDYMDRDMGGGASADLDAPSLPSSHFTSLLSAHIKTLAEESARDASSPFARLYRAAQGDRTKKKIKAILVRTDVKKEKKVELIAALLLELEQQQAAAAPTHASSPERQYQQQSEQHGDTSGAAASGASDAAPVPMQT